MIGVDRAHDFKGMVERQRISISEVIILASSIETLRHDRDDGLVQTAERDHR